MFRRRALRLCGCGQLGTRSNAVVGWLENNPKLTPLIERTNKNTQSPKIHISPAYIQLVSWYQVKEKELTLSALSSMGNQSRTPCCDGPQVFLSVLVLFFFRVILCCATFRYLVMCLRSDWPAESDGNDSGLSKSVFMRAPLSPLSCCLLLCATVFATTAPSIRGGCEG